MDEENAFLLKGMNRKLQRALESGNVKLLDQVLNEGVDVFQEATPAGDTALHTAAIYGHVQLVRKLIQVISENPETGMHFLRAQNRDGVTALHLAAKGGCEETLKLLGEKERDLACVKNKAGETALFKASEIGNVGMVEYLLSCTPEELDERADGQTPLHVAVAKLHTGVMMKLLAGRPALVDKADVSKRTALHTLALVVKEKFSPWLWKKITSSLTIAKIGKMILSKKSSLIYRVDVNHQSALHLAAKVGNDVLVRTILDYGSDCSHILDKDGRTALHLAVENASQIYERDGNGLALRNIISSLAMRRLIDCSDNRGQTALDIAIQKTDKDKLLYSSIKNYLRRHGASEKTLETETSRPKSKWRMDLLSVNAVLIATVAFAAAFTPPGDIDSHANPPLPFLSSVSIFQLYIVFDSLAFCTSLGSAVLMIYANFGNQQEDPLLTQFCVAGLWVALTSIALTFGAAIHLLVARKSMWLALLVWVMVCYVPIVTRLISRGRKGLLFRQHRFSTVRLIAHAIGQVCIILYFVGVPFYYLGAFVWGYFILPPSRMLILILSRMKKRIVQLL